MSSPYPPETRAAVLAAVRAEGMILPVARAWHIAPLTVTRWAAAAGIALPPAAERMRLGGARAERARWPGHAARRARARKLWAAGVPLATIAATLHLSLSGAHYAAHSQARSTA